MLILQTSFLWEWSIIDQAVGESSVGLLNERCKQKRLSCFWGGWVGPVEVIKKNFEQPRVTSKPWVSQLGTKSQNNEGGGPKTNLIHITGLFWVSFVKCWFNNTCAKKGPTWKTNLDNYLQSSDPLKKKKKMCLLTDSTTVAEQRNISKESVLEEISPE